MSSVGSCFCLASAGIFFRKHLLRVLFSYRDAKQQPGAIRSRRTGRRDRPAQTQASGSSSCSSQAK